MPVRAAVLSNARVEVADVPAPAAKPGEILLRVRACGVCRTDLHIVDGELPPLRERLIPGHQIVGETPDGRRVGVSWLGGVDGICEYCRRGEENLCDAPVFTGYSVNGGFAEHVVVREDFTLALPATLDDNHAAPLLCAGIIGYRALKVAGVQPGERVGLYGFGASAHLALPVLRAWKCEVYVVTRSAANRKLAESLGAIWVGEKPPVALDRGITFAPGGDVVVTALSHLRKGGVVAINAIHLDHIPQFDYDSLLWGERQIRSVANMTRADAREFLDLAAKIGLRPEVSVFRLEDTRSALDALRHGAVAGAVVVIP